MDFLLMFQEKLEGRIVNCRFEDSNDGEATVTSVEDSEIQDIYSAIMLDDSKAYIQIEFLLRIQAEYFVDKADAFTNDDATYDIEDIDWNDYVAHVSKEANMRVNVDVIFDRESEKIEEFYFYDLEETRT